MAEAVPSSFQSQGHISTADLINTTVSRHHSAAQGTSWPAGSFWRHQRISCIVRNIKVSYSLFQVQN